MSTSIKMIKHEESDQQDEPSLTPTEIESHLISVAKTFVQAINIRDFHPNSPLWSSMCDSFRASPHPPNPPVNVPRLEWLEWMHQLYEANPEWKMECMDASCYVEKKEGEVFMNLETSGIPPGIVTRSCALVKFRELKTGWRCVGFLGVNGGPGLEGERLVC